MRDKEKEIRLAEIELEAESKREEISNKMQSIEGDVKKLGDLSDEKEELEFDVVGEVNFIKGELAEIKGQLMFMSSLFGCVGQPRKAQDDAPSTYWQFAQCDSAWSHNNALVR